MSDTGSVTRNASERLHAIDMAKGVGILLVVFGHAWRGAFDAGVLTDAGLFRAVDTAIYAWHMPLFFLLSGLLFLDVLQRTPPARLVLGRVRQLLWPFALWTWIFFGVKLVAGQSANHPVSISDFPLIPLPPYEHLWFLWALFLAQLVVLGLFLVLRGMLDERALRVIFGVGAVVLVLVVPLLGITSLVFGAAVAHFPYFIAGIALGAVAHLRPPGWLVLIVAVAFGALLFGVVGSGVTLLASLCLTVLACVVFAWVDPGVDESPWAVRVLRTLGLYSLAIFLAHTIFSAAFRIGLLKVGVESLAVHLVVAMVVGVVGPIVLVWVSRKLGVAKALGF